jgi:hypothetical protein
MNRIFISTNYEKLGFLDGLDSIEVNLISDNDFIYYNSSNKIFCIEDSSSEIILFKDSLTKAEFIEIITIDKEKDYLLHHGNTNGLLADQKDMFDPSHIQQGNHIAGNTYYYEPVFKIILDDNIENKAEEILKVLFDKKNKVRDIQLRVDFLNNIYQGNRIDKDTLPLFITEKNNIISSSIDYFTTNTYDMSKDDTESNGIEQRAHLSALRDAILNDI